MWCFRGSGRYPIITFIVFLEFVGSPLSILVVRLVAPVSTPIAIDSTCVTTVLGLLASKTIISTTTRQTTTHPYSTLNTTKFVPVCPCFLPFSADGINIAKELRKLLCSVAHIDALIFAVLIDEVELPKHSKEGEVGARVVYDSFRAILDQEFEKLERLDQSVMLVGYTQRTLETYFVDLPPFFCCLVCEALVDQGHDLVEQLTRRSALGFRAVGGHELTSYVYRWRSLA